MFSTPPPQRKYGKEEDGAPAPESMVEADLLDLGPVTGPEAETTDEGTGAGAKRGLGLRLPSVKASVDGWESATTTTSQPATISQPRLARNNTFTYSPPAQEGTKTTYPNRLAEAKARLIHAKARLNEARNLKNEIKTKVVVDLDRLYQLVKEAEVDRGNEKGKEKEKEKKEKEKKKVTEPAKTVETVSEREESDLERIIREHTLLIKENSEKMEKLTDSLTRVQNSATYAGVVADHPKKRHQVQTAMHSIIITSKDDQKTGEEVMNTFREAVNAKDGWVTIDRIRKAKDRKIIVGCRTIEEKQKVRERIQKAGDQLRVEDVTNKDPLLILKGVLASNTDEDVLKALRNQNRAVFRDLDAESDRIEVKYRRKLRNPHVSHVVIKVSPRLWNRMMEAGEVRIDIQRIKVEDQSPLVQCTVCLGYGHSKRFCTETTEKCSHCGGPHMKAQCENLLSGSIPSCCNCALAKLDSAEHNAFSQDCPVRRKWEALARARVAYC